MSDDVPSPRPARARALRFMPGAIVVASCAWVAFVASSVLTRGALFGDAFPLLAAHVHALAQSFGARDGDLWIHGANLGYPAGTFAPLLPSLLPTSLHAAGVSVHTSIHVALFVPLVLLPASTFVGLRCASLSSWPAALAACAAALTLGGRFGIGIEGALAAGLLDEAWAVTLLPLAAGFGARFIASGRSLASAGAASVACALCHPVVGASLLLVWIVAWGASAAGRTARLISLLAFVVVGTLPMTLPALATWSARGLFGPHLDDGDGGYAPARFIPFIVKALDNERAPVLSLAALAGVLATAARTVRSGTPTRGVPFLVVATACCVVLLLGPHLAWGAVPFGRCAALLQLSLCALAGVGLVDLVQATTAAVPWRRSDQGGRALALVVRGALALSMVAIVVVAADAQQKRVAALRGIDDEPPLARDLAVLATVARESPPPARVAAAGSLRSVSRHSLSDDGWPGLWSSIGPAVASSPNAAIVSRDDVADSVSVTNTGLILVAADAPPSMRPPGRAFVRAGRFHIYDTRQRNWFAPILLEPHVTHVDGVAGRSFRDAALAWWHAGGYRTGRHLVDAHNPAPSGRGKVSVLDEEVASSRFSATLDVATDGPRAVLLKVSWHPWWRASIDGKPVKALRVSPALLAAEVPPGTHTLVFEFARPLWTWLLWLVPFVAVFAARRISQPITRRVG